MTGNIRAFVANQVNVAISHLFGIDLNVPPQVCLLNVSWCSSSMQVLLFVVRILTIHTGFTHFCREISLVAITRFGRHFLAKFGGRRRKNILMDQGV